MLSTEQMKGIGGLGWWRGRGTYLLQQFPPLTNPYLSVFPTYQCNTQQVLLKTVLRAGEFHVSGKKLQLTKTEMGLRCKERPKGKFSIQTMGFRPNPFLKKMFSECI